LKNEVHKGNDRQENRRLYLKNINLYKKHTFLQVIRPQSFAKVNHHHILATPKGYNIHNCQTNT